MDRSVKANHKIKREGKSSAKTSFKVKKNDFKKRKNYTSNFKNRDTRPIGKQFHNNKK